MRKKKKPVKVQYFTLHPYPSTLVVIVGDSVEDARKRMDKITAGRAPKAEDVSHAGAMCCARVEPKTSELHVFVLFHRKTNASVIAHEAVHAVNFVYNAHGVQWDFINDEPHAYFLGLIVGTITKAIKNAG